MADAPIFSKAASFAINLSKPAVSPVSVDWQTMDGSAKAGTDYQASSGALIFDVGDISKVVSVPCAIPSGDTSKWFSVILSNAVGGIIDTYRSNPAIIAAPGEYLKGANGSTILQTKGTPLPESGNDGDWAIDTADATAGNLWRKENGIWNLKGSIKGTPGTPGAKGDKGDQGPSGISLVNRGDWVSGTTYNPTDYVFDVNADGAESMFIARFTTPYLSETVPNQDPQNWVAQTPAAGKDGREVSLQATDTYIQWKYTGDQSWTNLISLTALKGDKGDQGDQGVPGNPGKDGADGAKWYSVTDVPNNDTGVSGDWALQTNGDVWLNVSGAWVKKGSLKGVQGDPGTPGAPGAPGTPGSNGQDAKWYPVQGQPSATVGNDGDWAFDTATATLGNIYYKSNGAWGIEANLKGPKGDTPTIQALLLSSTDTQTVTGPVRFGGSVTFLAAPSVPATTDWTQNTAASAASVKTNFASLKNDNTYAGVQNMENASKVSVPTVTDYDTDTTCALNAASADERYVRSVPSAGQTRITDLVENADGRAVFTTGTTNTVQANLSDLPFSDAAQKIQAFTVDIQFDGNAATQHRISFPTAFSPIASAPPIVMVMGTSALSGYYQSDIIPAIQCDRDTQTLDIDNTGFYVSGVDYWQKQAVNGLVRFLVLAVGKMS